MMCLPASACPDWDRGCGLWTHGPWSVVWFLGFGFVLFLISRSFRIVGLNPYLFLSQNGTWFIHFGLPDWARTGLSPWMNADWSNQQVASCLRHGYFISNQQIEFPSVLPLGFELLQQVLSIKFPVQQEPLFQGSNTQKYIHSSPLSSSLFSSLRNLVFLPSKKYKHGTWFVFFDSVTYYSIA